MTISGKRRDDSSVADEIAGNEDLVTEILLRLPINSLLRFKSVSKKWLSLISHPHFSHNYARLHNPNYEPSGLLLNHHCAGFQFVPFNGDGDRSRVRLSYPNDPGIKIYQSCNGLLMCCSSAWLYTKYKIFQPCTEPLMCSSINFRVIKIDAYICNPTTKQFTIIHFPSHKFKGDVVTVNLAFDPFKSPHYKLLCIRVVDEETRDWDEQPRTFRIDIYSSETGSWRLPISEDPLIFTAPQSIEFDSPIYWRGAIHWYTNEETSLYFNADTECLKTMPMPPFKEYHNVRYFGESRGHLHLIGINKSSINKSSAAKFDIWELETDYSGWFIRYHVNLDAAFPPNITTDAFSILCVARAEKEEESTLMLYVSGNAISFNLHRNTSKKLCDLVSCHKTAGLALDYQCFDAHQYIETLFHV